MWESKGRAPLCEFYPGICLTSEKKSTNNLGKATAVAARVTITRYTCIKWAQCKIF